MNTVLGGWQLTLINTMTSGLPVNITYSLSSSSPLYVSDLVTYRPNRVNNGPIKAPSSGRIKDGDCTEQLFHLRKSRAPHDVSVGQRNPQLGEVECFLSGRSGTAQGLSAVERQLESGLPGGSVQRAE